MSQLDHHVLDIDYQSEADRICARLREITARQLHRRGLVVAISGGIDSSVSCALAVRALGPERVFTLILPEQDSSDDSAARARILAELLGPVLEEKFTEDELRQLVCSHICEIAEQAGQFGEENRQVILLAVAAKLVLDDDLTKASYFNNEFIEKKSTLARTSVVSITDAWGKEE